ILLRSDVRLVTLLGPPGVGKTRLASHIAPTIQEHFSQGVVFVALASVCDAEVMVSTLAHGVGLKAVAGTSLLDRLKTYLCSHRILLVLDNLEQVVGASQVIADLLQSAPQVTVLATSR